MEATDATPEHTLVQKPRKQKVHQHNVEMQLVRLVQTIMQPLHAIIVVNYSDDCDCPVQY